MSAGLRGGSHQDWRSAKDEGRRKAPGEKCLSAFSTRLADGADPLRAESRPSPRDPPGLTLRVPHMELLIGSRPGPAQAAQGSPRGPPQDGARVAVRQRCLGKEGKKNQGGRGRGGESWEG